MTSQKTHDQLVDRIHEAGLVPVLWPTVLKEIGEAIGGNGGLLFAVRDGYVRGIVSPGHDETIKRFMNEGWSERDQALKRGLALNYSGFVNDADMFTDEELAADEVYANFYRHNGLDYRAGTIIPMPMGDSVALVLPRTGEQGPASRELITYLDSLRSHLARASMIANRLGFARARAQADAMQMLGLPAMVLRAGGRAFAANALFDALMPGLFQDRAQRVTIVDPAADALLGAAVSSLSFTEGTRSIPVPGTEGRLPMIVHVVPIRGAAHDLFAQAAALMVVTPVDRANVPTAEVLQGLFDLTPAEARIARSVGQTLSINDIAAAHGSSRETVRTQLRAVLQKTGLTRQQELVSLLVGKVMPR